MIVIGIDPGIEKTGIGIIEYVNNKLILLEQKLIKTESNLNKSKRLEILYNDFLNLINNFNINCASIEKIFFSKNVKTALSISEARGVILLALEQKKINIYEYTPLEVKQALIGYGRGTKNQIQNLVKIILNLDKIPTPDDVADGIALAITHINTNRLLIKTRNNSI